MGIRRINARPTPKDQNLWQTRGGVVIGKEMFGNLAEDPRLITSLLLTRRRFMNITPKPSNNHANGAPEIHDSSLS